MWSIHRGYAQKRTKLKALQEVTKWLWKTHSNNGGDSLVVFQKHNLAQEHVFLREGSPLIN